MKYALLAFLCLCITACDFFKKKTEEQPVAETTTTQTLRRDCEILGFSNPEPLAIWQMKNGQDLFVCKHNDTDKVDDNQFVGWANLYAKYNDKLMPFIPQVDSELPNEFIQFSIQRKSDSEIVIREQFDPEDLEGQSLTDVVEVKIDCGKGDCKPSEPICLPWTEHPEINDEAVGIVEKVAARKIKSPENYDITIADMVRAAFYGNKTAQKLVLDTPSSKLRVDGAAAETLNNGKEFLSRLKKLKCMK